MHQFKCLIYNGKLLNAKLKEVQVTPKTSLNVENVIEWIEVISKASTHGDILYVSRGSHATSGDIFKVAEISNGKKEFKDVVIEHK